MLTGSLFLNLLPPIQYFMQQQLDRGAPSVPLKNPNPALSLIVACALFALVIWAFSPALFSYCTSDDFLIFSWLRQSGGTFNAIAAQFTGPWLGLTEIKYYRPLPMLDWSVQYALWHDQLLNYHIVNLITYGVISVLVFLIAFELNTQGNISSIGPGGRSNLLYPTLAAAIFATYPDHGEAVNWLVGRLDLLATLFLLGCIWCHLRWRRSKRKSDFILAFTSLVLAFLSKENAILIPPILVLVELLLSLSKRASADDQAGAVLQTKPQLLLSCLRATAGYWFCLPIYLLVRHAAIGELVGGWGPKMAFYSRPIHLEILSSLQHTVVPLNNSVFASQPGFFLLWCLFLAIAAAGIVCSAAASIPQRGYLAFLGAWFVLTLLPTYRFFLIDGNLLNSRLAFMATVPLSLVLAIGFDYFANQIRWQKAGTALGGGFVLLSSLILYQNNQPWRAAGLEVNNFVAALNAVYKKLPDDPPVQIIGVPLEKDGVYVCLNALPGMTKVPFLLRDVQNCRMVDGRDTLFPVGFLRRQIESGVSPAQFFRWVSASSKLQQVVPGQVGSQEIESLFPSKQNPFWLRKRVVVGRQLRELKDLNVDCRQIDFINLIFDDTDTGTGATIPSLSFRNDVVTDYDRFNVCSGIRVNPGKPNQFMFPVGTLPNWAFGGTCQALKFKYTTSTGNDVRQISSVPSRLITPQIRLVSKASCDQNGAITLNAAFPKLTISFDATAIPECAGVRVEASKAALVPSGPNEAIVNSRLLHALLGTTDVDKGFFLQTGTYKLRLRALDKSGKPLGYFSDHLLIHV
jgi:hypothetical protein